MTWQSDMIWPQMQRKLSHTRLLLEEQTHRRAICVNYVSSVSLQKRYLIIQQTCNSQTLFSSLLFITATLKELCSKLRYFINIWAPDSITSTRGTAELLTAITFDLSMLLWRRNTKWSQTNAFFFPLSQMDTQKWKWTLAEAIVLKWKFLKKVVVF